MPYRRAGFALTPPSLVIFVISLVLAALAFLVHYAHVSVPIISSSRVFDVLSRHFGDNIGTFDHGQFFQEPSFPTHAADDVVGADASVPSRDVAFLSVSVAARCRSR